MLRICHLYPDLMNIYGDRGNVIALVQRARWHGLGEVEVVTASVGDPLDFRAVDLVFVGGGQDQQQDALARDFLGRGEALAKEVEAGLPMLAVCGSYQLLGRYYQPAQGSRIQGLGLLDLYTEARPGRMVGNVAVEAALPGEAPFTVVGFENHSGRTYLGKGLAPLGRVQAGFGNNGEDGGEGARWHNCLGTYLHGSLLPKNPRLADWLLRRAAERRGLTKTWLEVDDHLEQRAHEVALQLARQQGKARAGSKSVR